MPLWTPHLLIPDTSLITDPALALTMMARTWALRTRRAAAAVGGIALRGTASANVADGGTVNLSLSGITGLAQNDVVVVGAVSTSGSPATPSGWTNAVAASGTTGVYYKVMGASPDSSVSFWDTGTTIHSGAAIALAFSGVDTGAVLDAASPSIVTTSDATSDPPAITPVNNNSCIIVFCTHYGTGYDTTMGSITDYTSSITATGTDSNSCHIASWYRILSGGAGVSQNPTTPNTWSASTEGFTAAATIALRAA